MQAAASEQHRAQTTATHSTRMGGNALCAISICRRQLTYFRLLHLFFLLFSATLQRVDAARDADNDAAAPGRRHFIHEQPPTIPSHSFPPSHLLPFPAICSTGLCTLPRHPEIAPHPHPSGTGLKALGFVEMSVSVRRWTDSKRPSNKQLPGSVSGAAKDLHRGGEVKLEDPAALDLSVADLSSAPHRGTSSRSGH